MFRPLILFIFLAFPALSDPPAPNACSQGLAGPRHCIGAESFARDVCTQIAAEAALNDLPPGFLARLLWQESRFDPNAVSPARAMGIAQFIASTARMRGLDDPFNPADAIEKSAAYLAEMTRRYGNVGLAAIGYNGGERRAEGWIARTGGLARETVDYVRIITGKTAETWRDAPPKGETFALDDDMPFQKACEAMAENRRITPLTPPPPQLSAWGVQVGYGLDQSSARRSYDRLGASCRRAAPVSRLQFVPQARRGSARSIIAARIGADSRDEAIRICRAVSAAGCICRVYRN
ncbi:lytic transglycosylase domain-containing protein [Jannaschia donghaensis]|uniref:Membrane-bound lytic transglycosylase F n=1 Tax=Jannaschia donghaensis TaxID=420998 RepID=A0A0M6YGR5_9RHOB|nr:lytic transglycosylase domain-containing protein [Jannaschia donghaensis]CTQ48457.1 membrane-bound lytic transglycosylase F [Jannaschia donghaensis]